MLLISPAIALAAADLGAFGKYGFSSEAEMKTYLTLGRVQVREVPVSAALAASIPMTVIELPMRTPAPETAPETAPAPETGAPAPAPAPAPTSGDKSGSIFGDIIGVVLDPVSLEKWATVGVKVWNIIENNKPVANVQSQRVSVLPVAAADWARMSNWQGPATKAFTIEIENGFGSVVVSQTYLVSYNFGGQLDGKGMFLANTTLIPTSISVSWGFTLNSQVEIGTVVNTGSATAPVPGIDLQLQWKSQSLVSALEGREVFYVKGDGTLVFLTPKK